MLSTSLLTKYTRLTATIIALCWLLSACSSNHSSAVKSVYKPSGNPMQDVQTALQTAKSTNKLLLVVMGAQWCHDSRGLADNFEDEELSQLLSANYHTVFVDVGYFNDLSHITQRFEQAHYYATPTVMVINPQTEHLINASDMNIWGGAYSIPLSEYIAYFSRYEDNKRFLYTPVPTQYVDKITAFEQENAQRLTAAYNILAPNLKAQDNGGTASDLFTKQWVEVKEYRTNLQKDIQRLRHQAISSPSQALVFPFYPAFSWEQDPE
ncbi:MAG: hypothetical protein ACI82S_003098 [Patiriisocius sp.]|jgi:hypothetical protein